MSDNKIFGKNWFKQVGQVAIDNDIAYCLIWANFNPYNALFLINIIMNMVTNYAMIL